MCNSVTVPMKKNKFFGNTDGQEETGAILETVARKGNMIF